MIFDDLIIAAENVGLTVNDPNIHTARARLYRGRRRSLPYPNVVVTTHGVDEFRAVLIDENGEVASTLRKFDHRAIVQWAAKVLPEPEVNA